MRSPGVPDRRRVVVTGMGAITAAGGGVPALETAVRGTTHRFREVGLFSTEGLRVHIAGEIASIPASHRTEARAQRRFSRSDRLALVAVEEALDQSRLDVATVPRERIGTAIGTSTGGLLETESYFEALLSAETKTAWDPRLLSTTVGAPGDVVAATIGALGPRMSPSTACSSGAIAIAMGAAWIHSGAADIVVAGGTDALCRMTYSGFHALQALAPAPCRPFDRERCGLTLGEGAGALVLEDEAHARERGVPILGEVLGAGMSCDAEHPTAPNAEGAGASQALAAALDDARTKPADVRYLNAHGTGTPQNDACEARAVRAVFGDHTDRLPVSSTKGITGHLLGAAGAVEAIITLLALRGGFAPSTVGLHDPDPDCALDLVFGKPRTIDASIGVSNSYGFGGNNCSLVLRAT